MALHYRSGEEIRAGDRVLLDGRAAEVAFVADPDAAQTSLYLIEYGSGVMVTALDVAGQTFFSEPEVEEDLVFVGRADDQA